LRNKATFEMREPISEEIDELEQIYDETHPDFIGACKFGKSIARAWTLKLRYDFPHDRFRVYFTQYDNPIVRFHKVRANEHFWLTDEDLLSATDASFRDAIVYDTDYPDAFVAKGSS
jgi:hypothetical protein